MDSTQGGLEQTKAFADVLRVQRGRDRLRRRERRRGGPSWRVKRDAAQGEVFLEAIGLEEVGEFEGADVAAAVADFALEVTDQVSELFEGDAGA